MEPKKTSVLECFGEVLSETSSQWRGNRLICVKYYPRHNSYLSEALEIVPLTDDRCRFWAACNGQVFGFAPLRPSCIAGVISALAPFGQAHVVWKSKNPTPSTAKRWAAQWGKRTESN